MQMQDIAEVRAYCNWRAQVHSTSTTVEVRVVRSPVTVRPETGIEQYTIQLEYAPSNREVVSADRTQSEAQTNCTGCRQTNSSGV